MPATLSRRPSLTHIAAQAHWPVAALVAFLSAVGFAMLYSAANGNWQPWAYRQAMLFLPGFALMLLMAFIPSRVFLRGAYLFYLLGILLLVAVEVAGHRGMGAERWIKVGGFTLQPSEFMKLAAILVVARYFHGVYPQEKANIAYLLPPLLLLLVPAALILRQPNLGTATILIATGVMMCFAAGVRWIYFITVGVALLVAAPVAWQFLHDYQKQRILTFLNPEADPLGAGYNIIQSVIAIGSGEFTGKGFLQGSQGQLDFLPEKQTDFIFTMLAEEFGFLGSAVVLGCYALLLALCLGIAARSRNRFGALVAVGVASMLFLHIFINVGMTMALLPVVGVPLPLLSYGGTMQIAALLGFGLVLNAWAHRDEELPARRW